MKTLVQLLLAFFCIQTGISQPDGTLISRTPVTFPAYSEVQGIDWYYPKEAYDNAVADKTIAFEKLVYKSDGLNVVAFLIKPAGTQTKKLPVVIFNRGSYIRNDIAFVHAPLFQKLVGSGYAVIAPALRESEGGQGKDELVGAEIDDVINARKLLAQMDGVDLGNVFLLGESRGGMMCYQALKRHFETRAVATIGAITDLAKYVETNQGNDDGLRKIIPGYDKDREGHLKNRSVIFWPEAINVPLLILHGGADPQVSPAHALQLADALSRLGKNYRLMIFDGGNHILSGSDTAERDGQVIKWFDKYLSK